MDVAVTVGEGAILDWLPQETIVFEGARLKRRTVAEVAPGGALLACEMVVLGRAASGERFASRPAARLLVGAPRRKARLDRHAARRRRDADGAGFGAANALATVIGVWDEPQPHFEKARAAARKSQARCGRASPW